ncbi:MAG: HAMP domain-containing histidine kinase [Bacteroidales bacterium]|nr:HAMP domain-containing histidine kinase [Bacteroidales bacterium]
MKLLTKTTLYIATLSLFLFFIMGIVFFQFLKNMSLSELDRELTGIKEVVDEIFPHFLGGQLYGLPGVDSISIQPAWPGIEPGDRFGDTLMFDTKSNQFRTFRYLQFQSEHGGDLYVVKLFKSTMPADKLVERVTLMMTMMVILFLAGIFFLNKFIFANLWKDFFDALEKLKQFDTVKEPVKLGEPDIEEFMDLKKVLERMTFRLSSDYKELREYTDHTTHELQTPLAVIRTKTELLMQSKNLGLNEMQLIQSINSSADHLSRLNNTLALITRIENRQFTGRKEINLGNLLDDHLEKLHELVVIRGIQVDRIYTEKDLTFIMDQGLADVLITNLLKNAIVHNVDGGGILIEIDTDRFVICNEGAPLSFNEHELFKRFSRDIRKTGNFGLGLSLVKKICDYYGFKISYEYQQQQHRFTVVLP